MDFTIKTYRKLLDSLIVQNFLFLPYKDFCTQTHETNKKLITLRHDVDARKENSFHFAQLQYSLNIKATYYFRVVPQSFDEKVILSIADMGHEIGYHYETMDTCKGNVNKAYDEFCQHLEKFRKIVPIDTVCMHGSPMSKFDNRDIWKKYNYKELGIISEPYFDLDFNETFYLTDTGRRWNGGKVSIRDKAINTNECKNPDFLNRNYYSTFDIIKDIEKNNFPNQVMMNFHPQRWTDKKTLWYKELLLQNLKNQIKRLIVK